MTETSVVNLSEMLKHVKARGLMGLVLLQHGTPGGQHPPYLAACIDPNGKVVDPRNWDHQHTPEAALADLATRLEPKS